jgi:hypothetical protein
VRVSGGRTSTERERGGADGARGEDCGSAHETPPKRSLTRQRSHGAVAAVKVACPLG